MIRHDLQFQTRDPQLEIEILKFIKPTLNSKVYKAIYRNTNVALKIYHSNKLTLFEREINSLIKYKGYPFAQEHVFHGVMADKRPFLVSKWIDGFTLTKIKNEISDFEIEIIERAIVLFKNYLSKKRLKNVDFAYRNIIIIKRPIENIKDINFIDLGFVPF